MPNINRHVDELAEQLEFMRGRLIEAREQLDGAPIVMAYDNGGGQKGIRKNPAFDAYSQLMRTYTHTLAEYREAGGNGVEAKVLKFERFAKTMKKAADA